MSVAEVGYRAGRGGGWVPRLSRGRRVRWRGPAPATMSLLFGTTRTAPVGEEPERVLTRPGRDPSPVPRPLPGLIRGATGQRLPSLLPNYSGQVPGSHPSEEEEREEEEREEEEEVKPEEPERALREHDEPRSSHPDTPAPVPTLSSLPRPDLRSVPLVRGVGGAVGVTPLRRDPTSRARTPATALGEWKCRHRLSDLDDDLSLLDTTGTTYLHAVTPPRGMGRGTSTSGFRPGTPVPVGVGRAGRRRPLLR